MKRPPLGRLVALLCVMTVALVGIFARLTVLQVSQAGALRDRGAAWRMQTVDLPAERGQILDRNGSRLAISMPAVDLYVDPRYVTDAWGAAVQLAPLLGMEMSEVLAGLTAPDRTFVYLARQVEPAVADRVRALHLPGIGFLPSTRREYPAGPLAGQVLGFVGLDGQGLAGLELHYEHLLAGRAGERTQELDPYGQPIVGGVDAGVVPVPGASLQTTIDRDLQYQAQTALEAAVTAQSAHGGTVIVMDPATGDILAMASYPWFDPNAFEEAEPSTIRNKAVTDAFEPGSTNKVITAAAAVQEEVLALDQRLSVPWRMRVDEFVIHDSHPHPVMQMTLGDVIAESSNIGTAQVAARVGEPTLASYMSRFGLGHATGIGFPGEADGIMPPLYEWTDASLATTAYGQGITSTPVQMAAAYATIANDGRWVQPRLVRGTVDPGGVFHAAAPSASRRVVSAQSADMVTRMLAYAVDHGTGVSAKIDGFQVAGKTGTALIPLGDRPGYLTGQYIASFIGFLPAGDPEVVVVAILDRPTRGAAGFLFQRVARSAITRLSIEPADLVPLPPHALPVP